MPGMMARVRRVLFTILASLSLLLFMAIVMVWVRSFFVRDIVMHVSAESGNLHTFQSLLGNLHIISQLDGGSSGPLFWRTDRLSPDAIWNGGMSGYPVQIRKHFGFVFQNYTLDHYNFSGISLGSSPRATG